MNIKLALIQRAHAAKIQGIEHQVVKAKKRAADTARRKAEAEMNAQLQRIQRDAEDKLAEERRKMANS